jgi:signal transduction histidine kinase
MGRLPCPTYAGAVTDPTTRVRGRWASTWAWLVRVGPRARDLAAIGISLLFTAAQVISQSRMPLPTAVYVGLGCVASLALWWRRAHPFTVTLLTFLVFLPTDYPVPLGFALLSLAVRRRDRVLALTTAATLVAFTAVMTGQGTHPVAAAISAVFFVGAFVAVGAYVGARRDLVSSLRARAERAEAERELRADQARLAERTRIAGEMHDVLAHKVSLVALHAGGLEVNPTIGADEVERTAALIRSTAREALEDLRGVLGVLREEGTSSRSTLAPQPGLEALDALVEASRAAGVVVSLDLAVAGQPPEVTSRTAHRVVQEALTNVHKHARGAMTTVTVTGTPGTGLEVDVVNVRPVSADSLLPGSGMGLVGLRERVELAGGRLTAGRSADGGWQVHAWLPWPTPAPVDAPRPHDERISP